MNILLINKNEKSGGAAQVCQELIKELEVLGHKTSFFVKNKESQKNNVFEIKNNKFKKILSFLTSNDLDYYYGDKILDTEEFKKADIINLHNISGHFFKLSTIKKISKSKPIVWTFHDMHPISHYFAYSFREKPSLGFFTGNKSKFLSNIIWWNHLYLKLRKGAIYKKTNFHIASPSSWLKEKILQTSVKNKPITIINNGIDKDIFTISNKQSARKNLGLPENKKIILSLADGGKNNPRKGWSYIESINEHLKKMGILVISVGNKQEYQKENIKFFGTIRESEKLRVFYQAADLLLFPSMIDNFPMTTIESMACGTPVVAFDVGGIKEQIDHKINGYLAKYKNAEDLINGINFIYSSDYNELSKRCRAKIEEEFNSKRMTEKYLELYETEIKKYKNKTNA